MSRALALALAAVLLASVADGQSLTPGPPGPFVIDLRGGMSGVPVDIALYPGRTGTTTSTSSTSTSSTSTSTSTTSESTFSVPSRGFGYDVGAHVYLLSLGPTRVGIGASLLDVRGTSGDAKIVMRVVAPQLSFNFGTSNGWSYLSAGYGPARIEADSKFDTRGLNAGGGARWFLNNHVGIGFDLRFYQLVAIKTFPKTTLFAASVGMSVK